MLIQNYISLIILSWKTKKHTKKTSNWMIEGLFCGKKMQTSSKGKKIKTKIIADSMTINH